MLGQRHSQPTPTSLGQGCMDVAYNLPPALLAEWPGCFKCHCSNTGVERTPNKSKHTKLTLEKKIHVSLMPGFELATFRSRIRRSYKQAIPAMEEACSLNYTITNSIIPCSWQASHYVRRRSGTKTKWNERRIQKFERHSFWQQAKHAKLHSDLHQA